MRVGERERVSGGGQGIKKEMIGRRGKDRERRDEEERKPGEGRH